MSFNPRARLDPGQVRDVRGRRAGIVAGGGATLVIAIVILLLGGDPSAVLDMSGAGDPGPGGTTLEEACRTGSDAEARNDCRIVGYVNSIQEYWTAEFEANGLAYEPAETVLFTESVSTGCGVASSAVGPFYCPLDDRVYLDLGFFAVLEQQFGASGGPFAQAYVVAHEYGHHAQDLLGILAESGTGPAGDDSVSVRTELMADCFAGRWARGAAATDVIAQVTNADIAEALDAAAAVGDDRIQERVQGQVTPETWTHGSSSERVGWFTTGYEATNLEECDTFTASTL